VVAADVAGDTLPLGEVGIVFVEEMFGSPLPSHTTSVKARPMLDGLTHEATSRKDRVFH
jgi:hypothetical protein